MKFMMFHKNTVRFEFFTAVNIQVEVLRVVMLCRPVVDTNVSEDPAASVVTLKMQAARFQPR
jgi:hypothetical protein